MKTNIRFLIISRSFLLRIRNVSDKSCRKKRYSLAFFLNRGDYEKMWENIVERAGHR